jgi:hypothetical protein
MPTFLKQWFRNTVVLRNNNTQTEPNLLSSDTHIISLFHTTHKRPFFCSCGRWAGAEGTTVHTWTCMGSALFLFGGWGPSHVWLDVYGLCWEGSVEAHRRNWDAEQERRTPSDS